jgi:hypothetical protein
MSTLRGNGFRFALTAVGLIAAIGVSPASASLVLTGGTAGNIPAGSGFNELLSSPLFGNANSTAGQYGAQVSQIGNAALQYDFLGFEAGFANTFTSLNVGGQTFNTETFNPNNNTHATSLSSPLASFIAPGVNALLNFIFTVNSGAGNVTNGSNGDNSAGNLGVANFFVSTLRDGSLVLWLDDSGAGPDRDYDDFAVRIREVPLPPALLLFGSALLGMNWLRRRRQNLFG